MSYALGIDLGTTYSSAAIHRDGRVQVVELGTRSAAIPSVVLLRDDTVLAGEAAQRRSGTEPRRVAREFKRRIGDPTPVLVESTPYSAEALTARLLGWIVERVVEREGGRPASVAISHPANWGPYKVDLLRQAIRLADLDDVELVTEPEAAAIHYASQERVEPGSSIAVYDLGGGTFDAAVLRKSSDEGRDSFESLGRPEGIERLGGIDFDAAVISHVTRVLGGTVEELDPDDSVALQALTRLRQDCVDAKEALSTDVDVSIPVLLPNVQTDVRLTRSELESMIRPALVDSLTTLRRAIRSAGMEPEEISTILLVGGSSRIPLVAQLVGNEFGRPVALDTDPTNSVALGTALVAARQIEDEATDHDTAGHDTTDVTGAPAAAIPSTPPASESDLEPEPDPKPEPEPEPETQTEPALEPEIEPHLTDGGPSSRTPVLVGAGLAVVAALVAGYLVFRGSGGDPDPVQAAPPPTEISTSGPEPTAGPDPTTGSEGDALGNGDDVEAAVDAPAPTPCPDAPATACITDLIVEADGSLTATYVTSGYTPELEPVSDHIHFYFDSVVGDDERNAGTAGSGGDWRLWDAPNPFRATGGEQGRTGYTIADADAVGAEQLCSIVADPNHAVVPGTGNCMAIPRP
ncbi:MAG: Hsp70 family protein [Acidimicrobiales bacterium]|nr:Hsp70 family protein [Acidimicrobiales bacterium]